MRTLHPPAGARKARAVASYVELSSRQLCVPAGDPVPGRPRGALVDSWVRLRTSPSGPHAGGPR
jgi:hypothetical protein